MTPSAFPRHSWLAPWVAMYLLELPLILMRWGFDDWAGGILGWLLPLVLYVALGALLAGATSCLAWLLRRRDRWPEWAHPLSWCAVGALTAGLPIHATLFQNRLEAPTLGVISAALGALAGLLVFRMLSLSNWPWPPVYRFGPVLVLAFSVAQTADDAARMRNPRSANSPNLLLITIDTCQTARLTPYGGGPTVTPFLQWLADHGRRFDRVYTPIAQTGPAHATLFTGLHPLELNLTDNLRPMPLTPVTLAESLRSAGYATYGVPGNTMVRSRFHLHQGFDRYPQNAGHRDLKSLQWEYLFPWRTGRILFDRQWTLSRFTPDAAIQTDTALDLIPDRADPQPWFCWVHYFDAHAPYIAAPSDFAQPVSTDPAVLDELCSHDGHYDVSYDALAQLFGHRDLARRGISPLVATPEEIADVRTVYDAQLTYIDRQIERLFQTLESQGQLQNTIVVLTADHGEALYEHGYFGHSYFPYEEEHRIPLIIWKRGTLNIPATTQLLSLEDVHNLSALQIPVIANKQTVVRNSVFGWTLGGHPVSMSLQDPLLMLRGDNSRAIQTADGQKLVYTATVGQTPRVARFWTGPEWQWYDLNADPKEATNRYPLMRDLTSFWHLQQELDRLVRAYEQQSPQDVNYLGHATGNRPRRELEQLESLGYLQGPSSDTGAGVAPPPRYTPAADAARRQAASAAAGQ